MFFVATFVEDVVGWAHLEATELEKLCHAAKLTVGVLEEYRGHGIGSHLLHRGLEWAASNDYRKVYNSIPATNEDGLRFLETHGFETEATRKDHYRIDDEFVDERMLAKTL
jgi:ribosomal protein S18 acetylase RimI-like enzyme